MPASPAGSWTARRRRQVVGGVLALALAAGACAAAPGKASGPPVAHSVTAPAPTAAAPKTSTTVRRPTAPAPAACTPASVLDTWSLHKLADQTIVFPAEETDVTAAAGAARAGYGGMILFGSSAPADLGTQLQALKAAVPDRLGFIVMTDEEGGGVQRMANLVGSMPWAAQMGATMTPAQIQSLAESVGARMVANGVTMDLAPVVDVDGRAVEPGEQDPDGYRSFSGNTAVVSADGAAFARGMGNGGEVPVAKHFPGLGGVSENTDYGPAWTLPWSTLQKVALPPFEAAIKAGVPAIMVSNAKVRDFTTVPAALSAKLVTGELRATLGFKGLLVTDSLSAGAIADAGLSVPTASVEALEAGMDMVLFDSTGSTSADLSLAANISNAIVAAVGSGALPKSRLVSAVEQILATKKVNPCGGYWLTSSKGNVFNLGDARFFGSKAVSGVPAPVVGVAATPDGGGYWLVTSRGNVFNFGDARFDGSEATTALPAPVVAVAASPGRP